MQILMTRKKWLFVGVITLSVGMFFLIQNTISSTSRKSENVHRFRLQVKSEAQRRQVIDKYLDIRPDEDTDHQSLNDFDFNLDSQSQNAHPSTNQPTTLESSSEVDELARVLGLKLSTLTTKERKLRPVCHNPDVIGNSCDNGDCLQLSFPSDPKIRVAQLVDPPHLKISNEIQATMDSMVEDIPGKAEFSIVTAASSNHFLEVQGLIKSVHESVHLHFKNFTFIFVNIGLTSEERAQVAKHCKCHVVDFPYHKFPSFLKKIRCYSWKPIILNALIGKASTVIWADTSIRFKSDPSYLRQVFERVDARTIQLGSTQVISPFRTFRSMYHYFGDEPCMYVDMFQGLAGVFLFKSEFFVKRAVLDPWTACALSESCMCPTKQPKKSCVESRKMEELWVAKKGPVVYGLCHRFDQSSISLILHKLYQGFYHWVNFHLGGYFSTQRKDNQRYFESLEKESPQADQSTAIVI